MMELERSREKDLRVLGEMERIREENRELKEIV